MSKATTSPRRKKAEVAQGGVEKQQELYEMEDRIQFNEPFFNNNSEEIMNVSISIIKPKVEKALESLETKALAGERKYIGILLVLCGAFIYAIQSFLIKIMFTDFQMGPLEQFYVKSLTYLAISIVGLRANGLSIYIVNSSDAFFIISRALLGIGDNVLLTIGVIYLNVSTATALYYMFPIITIVMSWTLLKEPVKALEVMAAICSFGGVIMIVKPKFLFDDEGDSQPQQSNPIYMLITLASAMCAGSLFVLYRKTSTKINYFIMTFYYGIICSITVPLIYMFTPYEKPPLNFSQFIIAAFTAAITLLGSLLIYWAYQYDNASRLTSVTYTQVVFTFIIDYAFFHPHIDYYHLFGAALIVGASFALAFMKCVEGTEAEQDK